MSRIRTTRPESDAGDGPPEAMVDLLMGLNNIIREGHTAAVSCEVQEVLGWPPRAFAEFAADHADSWR